MLPHHPFFFFTVSFREKRLVFAEGEIIYSRGIERVLTDKRLIEPMAERVLDDYISRQHEAIKALFTPEDPKMREELPLRNTPMRDEVLRELEEHIADHVRAMRPVYQVITNPRLRKVMSAVIDRDLNKALDEEAQDHVGSPVFASFITSAKAIVARVTIKLDEILKQKALETLDDIKLTMTRSAQLQVIPIVRSHVNAYLTTIDGMTGLLNSAAFEEQAKREVYRSASNGPLTMIYADIDKFKSINDSYGHPVGDQIIIEMSKRLKVRLTDIAARPGGEEFALLCPNTDESAAKVLAQRIIDEVTTEPFKVTDKRGESQLIPVTLSLGITVFTRPPTMKSATREFSGEKSGELIKRADMALYNSKEKGRNCASLFSVDEKTQTPKIEIVYRPKVRGGNGTDPGSPAETDFADLS